MIGNSLAQNELFRWVNTILGNVERAIDATYRTFEGTYHAMRRPYVGRYLGLL